MRVIWVLSVVLSRFSELLYACYMGSLRFSEGSLTVICVSYACSMPL